MLQATDLTIRLNAADVKSTEYVTPQAIFQGIVRRAVSTEVGEKLIQRIKWSEDYTRRNGNEMNNNLSPGNKAGGLTTILEKSLGAVAGGANMICFTTGRGEDEFAPWVLGATM